MLMQIMTFSMSEKFRTNNIFRAERKMITIEKTVLIQ